MGEREVDLRLLCNYTTAVRRHWPAGLRGGPLMVVYQYRRVWSVDLNQPWVLVGSAEARHLHGDATHSPLNERATNSYISAGIAYRF
jgi:hypothetical protein